MCQRFRDQFIILKDACFRHHCFPAVKKMLKRYGSIVILDYF